jgi:hypothetical protein
MGEDKIPNRLRGSARGENAAAMAGNGKAVGEGGEVEIKRVHHAEKVDTGGSISRCNPEHKNLARTNTDRLSYHGMKHRED